MKEEIPLPFPKDDELIKYINSQLKSLRIHPVEMRTKKNKNEVHICNEKEKLLQRKQQLDKWIVCLKLKLNYLKLYPSIYFMLPFIHQVSAYSFCLVTKLCTSQCKPLLPPSRDIAGHLSEHAFKSCQMPRKPWQFWCSNGTKCPWGPTPQSSSL